MKFLPHDSTMENSVRACCHGLVAEVLRQLAVEAAVHRVGFLHRRFALAQGHGSAALEVGDKQRPRLADAVAPLRDVVTVQPAAGLPSRLARLHQFAFAAHGFLAIGIGVVEVRQVGRHADEGCHYQYGAGPEELRQRLLAPGLFEIGAYDEEDDEQEVVGHLHVVRRDLQGHEHCCHQSARQQASAVGQHDARQRGWDVGQGDELPDVPRRDEDEEVG